MDKKQLSERDICTKYMAPALKNTSWDIKTQRRVEVSFTNGKIIVRGKFTQSVVIFFILALIVSFIEGVNE